MKSLNIKLAQLRFEQLPRTGYINQLSQILLPVAQGLGFTVLPESAIQNFAWRSKLHVVEEHQAVMETLFFNSQAWPRITRALRHSHRTITLIFFDFITEDICNLSVIKSSWFYHCNELLLSYRFPTM